MAHPTNHPAPRQAFFRRHRWWTALALTIVLLLLVIFFVLPLGVRWGIERWLEGHDLRAQVEDVDFNLFSGYLGVHSLLAERAGQGGFKWIRASMEIAWRPIFKKHIRIDDVSVTDARLRVVLDKNGAVYVGGFRVKPAPGPPRQKQSGWEIGFGNIDLKNVLLQYQTPEFEREVLIRRAHLDPMQTWNPSSAGGFSADLAIGNGMLHLQGSARPYSHEASVQGRLHGRNLPLTWAAAWLKKEAIQNAGGTLAADAAFSISRGGRTQASMQGELELNGIKADLPQARIRPLTLSWDGSAHVILPARAGARPRVSAKGTLAVQGAAVQLTSQDMSAALQSIRIQGDFQSNTQSGPAHAGFLFSGQAEAGNLRVWRTGAKTALAEIQKLILDRLSATGAQFRIETAEVTQGGFIERPNEGGQALAEPKYMLSFAALTVQHAGLDADRQRLEIGAVDMGDARVYLVINRQGKLKIMDLPAAGGGRPQGQGPKVGTPPWSVVVDRLSIGRDSALHFVDNSVTPAVDLTVSHIQASLANLNSVSNQPAPVHLQASLGKYASVKAQGSIVPLAKKISMDIDGKVKQFSLPELRGYMRQKLGYTIQSGQLYADFHLLVDRDRMDSSVKLFITDLNLDRLSQSQLGPMEHELGMPLNTALDLLRDRHGNIRLQLPVTGSWAKPDVHLGGVVAKAARSALYKAIKAAALSYFAPLGAVYIAGKLFGKLVALRLKPIDFDAGQGQLDPADKRYLDQVAEKMKDRPETRLLICGKATDDDRRALARAETQKNQSKGKKKTEAKKASVTDAELLKLATNRAENTRAYLVNKGIGPGRLPVCAPRIESGQNARPQVELAI